MDLAAAVDLAVKKLDGVATRRSRWRDRK